MSIVKYDVPQLAEKYDTLSDTQYNSGRSLVDRLSLGKGCTALDLGCGTGRLAFYAAGIVGPEGKVLAIDPSPHRIAVAKKKLASAHVKNVRFDVAGSHDLKDLEDESFCSAYLSAVFHWVDDKETTLEELYRVIMPGGKLGITTGDKSIPFTVKRITDEVLSRKPFAGSVDLEKDASQPLTKVEIEYLLKAAGFKDIDISVTSNKTYYSSAEKALEFVESSSFGTFLRHVPARLRESARAEILAELEKKRTSRGIELEGNTLTALATKSLDTGVPKYFATAGKENTYWTIALAAHVAKKRGIKHIVVASTSGETGVKAAEILKDTGIGLAVVTANYGFGEDGAQPFDPKARKRIESLGGRVYTGTLALGGLDSAFRELGGYPLSRAFSDTLRIFGQGTKVIVEIAASAADAGLVPFDDIIAVAGTHHGADTAAIVRAAPSNRIFDIRVREYIAKPRDF